MFAMKNSLIPSTRILMPRAAIVSAAATTACSRSFSSAPALRPNNPEFSSGPTTKRPGWTYEALSGAALGRSHRSSIGKKKLKQAIDMTRAVLGVPDDYHVGIVPASDTGAFEMAMWHLLGQRPVDCCYWESFGKGWMSDLALLDVPKAVELNAGYGQISDFSQTSAEHDIIFTFNGTTSGVRVPNCDWISDNREGLTLCDATSACFAMDMPWPKLDVTTFSWQKCLGGEGAHGMLILSPKAVERLESYTPPRPLPKIFRMTKKGELIKGIFTGATINTPSMMCVEDYIDALEWSEQIGGLEALIAKSMANLSHIEAFVEANEWAHFLPESRDTRSNTSVCLSLDVDNAVLKKMTTFLEDQKVAYDIGSYRDAPAGLRIWCGPTVEEEDVARLTPWLEYAYQISQD